MPRMMARRVSSGTLVRSENLTRRWQSSGPPPSYVGFDSMSCIRWGFPIDERLPRPYVHFQLLKTSLPRAAPEFEKFVNSIGKTKAIVHDMKYSCSQAVFEDAEKTADYAVEMNGRIFPPGATIEQGGIPLIATAILPSTSTPDWVGGHHHSNSDLHLQNMPSLIHPSELDYHELKEWIEVRCGCETRRLGLILQDFGRSDFAEGEMPPAIKAMFDASSYEKHVFLTRGVIRVRVDCSSNDAIMCFNSLLPADRIYPGAKEPAVLTKPQQIVLARSKAIINSHSVCASLIPRYVRPSCINKDAVWDFVERHLKVEPQKVVVHELPFYPSQFPQDARPPELDGPDSPGVTMLTSGWVSMQLSSKDERNFAMKRWHRESFADELPGSSKVLFMRASGRWHEENRPWMRWMSREELKKLTFPHKFLLKDAKSWNPREPAVDDEQTGVIESLPPRDLRWSGKDSVQEEEGREDWPVSNSADEKEAYSAHDR